MVDLNFMYHSRRGLGSALQALYFGYSQQLVIRSTPVRITDPPKGTPTSMRSMDRAGLYQTTKKP